MSCIAQDCCPPPLFPTEIPPAGEQLFGNTAQTATACCNEGFFVLNGGCRTVTVAENTVFRSNQSAADQAAYDQAYAAAFAQLTCSCGNMIPAMTDYDQPNGEVIYSSDSEAYAAWHAFDGEEAVDNYWHNFGSTDPAYIGYKFPSETVIKTYRILPYADEGAGDNPTAWTFEGSHNGTDWTVLDTQQDITSWTIETPKEFSFTNVTAYQYYRLNITEVDHNRDPFNIAGLTPAVAELVLMPCIPQYYPDQGDPALAPPNPSKHYGMTIHADQPRLTWTAPDVFIDGEFIQIDGDPFLTFSLDNYHYSEWSGAPPYIQNDRVWVSNLPNPFATPYYALADNQGLDPASNPGSWAVDPTVFKMYMSWYNNTTGTSEDWTLIADSSVHGLFPQLVYGEPTTFTVAFPSGTWGSGNIDFFFYITAEAFGQTLYSNVFNINLGE